MLLLVALPIVLSGCGIPTNDPINQPEGIFQIVIVSPLGKSLIFLNNLIQGIGIPFSWGWAIIIFTLAVKLVTLPLTLKQLQSAKSTQELQPKLAELQAKYKNDRQKLADEQMKLYKEAGVNPMGGCLPLLVQMPILFGLYQALYGLTSSASLKEARFFWVPDLSYPDLATGMGWITTAFNQQDFGKLAAYLSLPIVMLVSQIALQKMSQPAISSGATDKNDQARMMNQMMMFMPLMFGYITLGLPSGLTLYWTASNLLSMVQQYFITGWGGLGQWIPALKPRTPAMAGPRQIAPPPVDEERVKQVQQRRRRKK